MPKTFIYKTGVSWNGHKRGTIFSAGKLNVGVATPPEFNGEEGFWSPEELLVSSVNSCIMTTFLYYVEKDKIDLRKYESEAEGVLEKLEKGFMFSKIVIRPVVTVGSNSAAEKARQSMELAEKNCFISNSLKAKVELIPEIKAVGA